MFYYLNHYYDDNYYYQFNILILYNIINNDNGNIVYNYYVFSLLFWKSKCIMHIKNTLFLP